MSHVSCCVVNCKNTSRKSQCKFYKFPTAKWKILQRHKWIAAVRRLNVDGSPWIPKPHDYICSDHFIGGKKSEEELSPSYIPTIFPTIYKSQKVNESSAINRYKFLRGRQMNKKLPSTINPDVNVIEYAEVMTEIHPAVCNKVKIDVMDIKIEDVDAKFPESESVDIKMEAELHSAVVFDEVHVKEEVKEEPLEYVAQDSPNYEISGTSQSVYCDICWMDCKDAEGLEHHEETSAGCKQHNNASLSVEDRLSNSSQEENGKIHVFPTTTDIERCTNVIPNDNGSDPTSNMKLFVEPIEITTNVESSSAGKRHTCPICNKSFTQRTSLNMHQLIHTGKRPFSCDVCNQTFTRKSNLTIHKIKHTGESRFTCDVCNQTFIQKGHLNTHKLKHTGERPFNCEVCNQTFTRKSHLNRHNMKHTGDRPFSCVECNQTFTRKAHLIKHNMKHTGERTFSCDLCDQTFSRKSHLNKHKLTHSR